MGTINEKITQGETVVTALTPPGDEIHGCAVCGGEINIAKEDCTSVDQERMTTVWHRDCYGKLSSEERQKYKNTLLRIE